jgi:hypothetical protein
MLKTILLVAAFGIAVNLAAAELSGKWVGSMASGNTVGSPTARIYLTLQRNGDAISGTLAYEDESKQVTIEKPALNGDQLTFEVHDNPTRVVKFRLTIGEDSLNGEATSGDRAIQIAMTRPN